jgi:hypothetical protein
MTTGLRIAAVVIAIAGVIDPALAIRQPAPLPVEIRLPAASDPDFAEAETVRRDLLSRLGTTATANAGDDPHAVIAIGNADLDVPEGTAVIAISIPRRSSSVRVLFASAEAGTDGQQASVVAKLAANGMRGRKTAVELLSGSAQLGRIEHLWTQDDEVLETRIPCSPPKVGLSVVRLSVSSAGAEASEVDVPVVVSARRFDVFIYEPRPTWAASFVRQVIEAHDLFRTLGAARTSRGVATVTSRAAPSLTSQVDAADALVVSGLDALSLEDETRLHRFVTVRGGALVLIPDAKLPERMRQLFQLPALEESLFERPVPVATGQAKMLVSELLLMRPGERDVRTLARVSHGSGDRTAIFAAYRGRGQVVVSGALDAWRFRGEPDSAFASVWQGLIADAAASSVPRVAVEVEPALARPGEAVTLRVTVRETEWTKSAGGFRLPAVAASVIAQSGSATTVRLWPGTAAGEYLARFPAPRQGAYDVRVVADGRTHDVALVVRDDALTLQPDRKSALAFLARNSGGDAIPSTDLDEAVARLRLLDRPVEDRRIRPMRSAWWIVPFSALLGLEWTLRRRTGQR